MEVHNQSGKNPSPAVFEGRRRPRFPLLAEIHVHSRSAGRLQGHTLDISQTGVSALLTLDLPVGEVVELEFELPSGPVSICALVRNKIAFRYGFQFVEPDPEGAIKAACSQLAAQPGGNPDSAL
ncbi:MAG TPA: PilZ domain-containing protein [Terriglobales bacterium]|nr:PilZ domain-containing protein [Terriglobales bacterium]